MKLLPLLFLAAAILGCAQSRPIISANPANSSTEPDFAEYIGNWGRSQKTRILLFSTGVARIDVYDESQKTTNRFLIPVSPSETTRLIKMLATIDDSAIAEDAHNFNPGFALRAPSVFRCSLAGRRRTLEFQGW